MRAFRNVFFPVLFVVALACVAAFFAQNSDPVPLRFFKWESRPLPVAYHLLLAFVAGFLLASFIALVETLRLRGRLRKVRRAQEMLEREVDALRNQPLFEEPAAASKSVPPLEDESLGESPLRIPDRGSFR